MTKSDSDIKRRKSTLAKRTKRGRVNKYRNVRTENKDTGEKYDSKLERSLHEGMVADGITVIREVTIPLLRDPDTLRIQTMKPDFAVIVDTHHDRGTVEIAFVDAKGAKPTRDWSLKRAIVAEKGIPVHIVHNRSELNSLLCQIQPEGTKFSSVNFKTRERKEL